LNHSSTDFYAYIAEQVERLAGPDAEDAWLSLVDLGPEALPLLVETLAAEKRPSVRAAVVSILWQPRLPEVVPVLPTAARLSPRCVRNRHPATGVERGSALDEFEALGLGQHRSNDNWLAEVDVL